MCIKVGKNLPFDWIHGVQRLLVNLSVSNFMVAVLREAQ